VINRAETRLSTVAIALALLLVGCQSSPTQPPATASATVSPHQSGYVSGPPLAIEGLPPGVLASVRPVLTQWGDVPVPVQEEQARPIADTAMSTSWAKPWAPGYVGSVLANTGTSGDWVFAYETSTLLTSNTHCSTPGPCSGHFLFVGIDSHSGRIDPAIAAELVPDPATS